MLKFRDRIGRKYNNIIIIESVVLCKDGLSKLSNLFIRINEVKNESVCWETGKTNYSSQMLF